MIPQPREHTSRKSPAGPGVEDFAVGFHAKRDAEKATGIKLKANNEVFPASSVSGMRTARLLPEAERWLAPYWDYDPA